MRHKQIRLTFISVDYKEKRSQCKKTLFIFETYYMMYLLGQSLEMYEA